MYFSFTQATSDTFTIQSLVGSDATPPTVPTNFSVTPVSTSQINMSWDASSDNVSVGGYQVFRDSTQIATTTLTNYSDTGLSDSTVYNYYITAFDTSFNYATSTATISTSTKAIIATSTPTTNDSSSSNGHKFAFSEIQILNFVSETTQHSISISFDTNVYTQMSIQWGRTTDYNDGYIASDILKKNHSTVIEGLKAGTVYELQMQLVDRIGRYTATKQIKITTDSRPDTAPPPNVSNFKAWRTSDSVRLSWTNPDSKDFSHVRVMSSDYFYPGHAFDGWLVYDGSGESVRDERIIKPGKVRYYTVFSYDGSGNISSGAVTYVVREDVTTNSQIQPIKTATTSVAETPVFTFNDIVFTQNGYAKQPVKKLVTLRGNTHTIISLPYELLPEHLKTIVVTVKQTVKEEETKSASFLMRINPKKTGYEARITTPSKAGQYSTELSLFDYSTQQYYRVSGVFTIEESSPVFFAGTDKITNFTDNFMKNKLTYFYSLLLVFLFVLVMIILKKRWHHDNNE